MSNTYFMWTLEKLQEFWDDHISALFARKNSVYTKTEIDTKTAALEGAMAVVQSTDTATVAISSGQYVLWKGSLYTASSAIAIDDTLSLSNLTAVNGGGFNALDSARASGDTALGGRVDLVNGAMAIVATGDVAPKAISEGQYVLWGGVLHTANSAIADGATLTVSNLTPVTDGGFNALNDGLTSLNSNIRNVESVDRLLSLTTVNSSSLSEKSLSYNWNNYRMLVIVLASNTDIILATTMIPTEMITQYITDFYVSYTSDSQTVAYTRFSTSAVGKVNVWTNNTSAKKIAIYGVMRKN